MQKLFLTLVLSVVVLAIQAPAGVARAAVGDTPPGYELVNSTPNGRSFSTQKPGVTSVQAALQATLRDLTGYFGARPAVRQAYEDASDHRSGGATFFVTYAGERVKGHIFCKLEPQGATVAVIGATADASAAEWRRLLNVPAGAAASTAARGKTSAKGAAAASKGTPLPAAATGPLRQHPFADGTGSIGLLPGWTTDLSSCAYGAVVHGPAGQRVVVGTIATVYLPTASLVQQQRSMGMPSTFPVAPYGPLPDVLRTLSPQLSALARMNGRPTFFVDNLVEKQSLPPMFPGGRSSLVTYGLTEDGPQGRQHYRVLAKLDAAPPASSDFWLMRASAEVRAPDAIFDRELPAMLATVKAWRPDDAAMGRRIDGDTAAGQRNFQRQQRDRTAAFDRYIAGQKQSQNDWMARADAETKASNDRLRPGNDFIETIRGYRTIEDTRTGQRTSADLGNIDNIVQTLNERDPDRYRQIPLRDEAEGK